MLPPFIIEEIRKREEERNKDNRIQPELPLPSPRPLRQEDDNNGSRGYIDDILDENVIDGVVVNFNQYQTYSITSYLK